MCYVSWVIYSNTTYKYECYACATSSRDIKFSDQQRVIFSKIINMEGVKLPTQMRFSKN